mmetsp:Transcript_127245/g.302250  ORF Transcript_127245/g.302250 Transcript_127245/m.302250 type:complete len:224 (-) Transcript_127245:3835-4506(-)
MKYPYFLKFSGLCRSFSLHSRKNKSTGTPAHQMPRPMHASSARKKWSALQHTTSGLGSMRCFTMVKPWALSSETGLHQIIFRKLDRRSGHMASSVTQKTGMHCMSRWNGRGKEVNKPKFKDSRSMPLNSCSSSASVPVAIATSNVLSAFLCLSSWHSTSISWRKLLLSTAALRSSSGLSCAAATASTTSSTSRPWFSALSRNFFRMSQARARSTNVSTMLGLI